MTDEPDILNGKRFRVDCADCLPWLKSLPDNCVDLIVCSPPYEAARTYGIDFKLRGQGWVDWAVERYVECVRVSKGLVVWVVEGQTRQFRYSAAPLLMAADLHRRGVHLRTPPIFHRVGIPGSGGPDWWRNDYEFCIVGSSGGKLAWSDNTATGHPPRWAPGGAMSNRTEDGRRKNSRDKPETKAARVNQWGHSIDSGATVVDAGGVVRSKGKRPSHFIHTKADGTQVVRENRKVIAKQIDGMHAQPQHYSVPVLANPGNVMKLIVGGGVMGSKLAHENEAPFPESLPEQFIRCFAQPGGIVLDPFSGSGTTAAVALKWQRRFIGCDVRQSQVDLTLRRIKEVQSMLAN